MFEFFKQIIIFIGNSYQKNRDIYNIVGSIFTIMLFYKKIYVILGFFMTRKFEKA